MNEAKKQISNYYLEIVDNREFLEHIVCDECNLCAVDCRYRCRYIREKKVELEKLHLHLNGIELAIPRETEIREYYCITHTSFCEARESCNICELLLRATRGLEK